MARAREEFVDAALSYFDGAENRLTELLATTLDYHDEFARRLFVRVDVKLPGDGVRFEVHTQKAVAEGARLDMVVFAIHEKRGLVAQMWSEHKLRGGAFRDMQLENYRDALAKAPGSGRLIGIVGEVEAEREGEDWKMLTWQEVAELANGVGRAWGRDQGAGRNWRRAALDPAAPARERLLHEFIWYVEKENDAVVDPLDSQNLEAFKRMSETTAGLFALLQRAGQHMRPAFEPEPEYLDGDPDGHRFWQLFQPPEDSWLQRLRAGQFDVYPELAASADDRWWSASSDEPAFAAGYTLHELLYEPLAANEEWLARLREEGLDFDVYFGLPRVWCTMPMTKLLSEATTLDDQARALARWASASFELVEKLDPGEFELPSKRRRRSRKALDGAHETQHITERDLADGVIRIPRGETKALFPPEPGEVELDLRGTRLSCAWDPRLGGRGGRELSGRLKVGREALAKVEAETRLSIVTDNGVYQLS